MEKKKSLVGDGPSPFGELFLWLVVVVVFYGVIALVAFRWSEIIHFFKGLFGAIGL